MTAAELLTQLHAVGVEIRAADDSLLCRPRPAVSDELRREIAAHKAELLALLTRPRAPECPDWRSGRLSPARLRLAPLLGLWPPLGPGRNPRPGRPA